MRVFICCVLLLGIGALAEERVKRQAYTFPGPRSDRSHRPAANAAPVYAEEQDEGEVYPRRQFQAQPVQPQYAPQARAQAPAAPAPQPAYEPAPRQAAPAPRTDSAPRRRSSSSSSSSSNRANKYGSAPQQSLNAHEEEPEEEQGPDPLTLLLEDSQFTCGAKNDGYYADDSVGCRVFHYCVGGAKHSWMCPENTVFHQVHLNCVPDAQDICTQSQKFHFVNEYLYKPVDYEGPNNTARYSQRYYPDGYSVGDPIVAPQEQRRAPAPQPQSYAPPAQAAPRSPPRQVAPAQPSQPSYRAPAQPSQPSYRAPAQQAQPRPASRPSRPLESYPVEEPPSYRQPVPVRAAEPQQAYRGEQPHEAAPPQTSYREVAAQQVAAQPQQGYRGAAPQAQRRPQAAYSSEEYQPQPQPQSRRAAAAAPQRPTAAYAPSQTQHRGQHRGTSARAPAGYQPYASNQAAGVHYDEDY